MKKMYQSARVWVRIAACAVGLLVGSAVSEAAIQVNLAWDPSPEAEITGYTLRFGNAPGSYDSVFSIGNTNTATLDWLTPGATYYCVVSARAASGLESTPSNEISFKVASVHIDSISSGASFNAGVGVPISVQTASDVAEVRFYSNSKPIGSSDGSTTPLTWAEAASGQYTITAVAYDSAGQVVDTAEIAVTVVRPEIGSLARLPDGTLQFTVVGAAGRPQTVEVSTDLQNWSTLTSVVNESGTVVVQDLDAAAVTQRFYRVVSQ